MSASLRERVRQLLLENDEPTPGTYFGNGYCCRHCGSNMCEGCDGGYYGGAKPNPWIEAVKKYGSVKEAKKYYKKGQQEPAPQGRFLSQEKKDEIRAKILMRKEAAREGADEELANRLLAQTKADYKKAKRMAPKRFTQAKAKALVKKIKDVIDKNDFTDDELEQFSLIIDYIESIPISHILKKK
jgi:hypothetical protein